MRVQVIVAGFLILQCPIVFGQVDHSNKEMLERARMKYQFSVGFSISKMQSNVKSFEEILEQKRGYVIQGGINQFVAPKLDLSFLIGFSNKGNIHRAHSVDSSNAPNITESIDEDILNYIILSVPLTYYIDKGSRLGISAGPYLGSLVSDKQYSEQYINGVRSTSFAYKNVLGYKKFDFGLSAELSYRMKFLKNVDALLKVRWDRGLLNVSPGSAAIYNQIFAFQIGVIL